MIICLPKEVRTVGRWVDVPKGFTMGCVKPHTLALSIAAVGSNLGTARGAEHLYQYYAAALLGCCTAHAWYSHKVGAATMFDELR